MHSRPAARPRRPGASFVAARSPRCAVLSRPLGAAGRSTYLAESSCLNARRALVCLPRQTWPRLAC